MDIEPLSQSFTAEVDEMVRRAGQDKAAEADQSKSQEKNQEGKTDDKSVARTPVQPWDKYIWGIYLTLLIVSVVELYGASSREVHADNIFGPIMEHGKMLFLGLIACYVVARTPYKWFITLTPVFAVCSVLAGIYALVAGEVLNGAARSFRLCGIPIQPAEMLKLSAVLVIALVCSKYQLKRGGVSTKGVVICAVTVLIFSGLLVTQGLTNTILLMTISIAMLVMGNVKIKKLLVVLLVYGMLGGCYIGYKIMNEKERVEQAVDENINDGKKIDRTGLWMARVSRWGDNEKPLYEQEMTRENQQEMIAYMAQANGGVTGRLPGNSREASRLPLAFSDFIFSIIIEDWGFIGGFVLLLIYLSLLGRAAAIATSRSRIYPALLVLGMAVMVSFQALFHMAIVTGVFPVSGQPLPLISKGGTSILITSVAFGIMLSVSKYSARNDQRRNDIKQEISELPGDLTAENPTQLK